MCYDRQLGLVVQTQTAECDRVISDTVVDAGSSEGGYLLPIIGYNGLEIVTSLMLNTSKTFILCRQHK